MAMRAFAKTTPRFGFTLLEKGLPPRTASSRRAEITIAGFACRVFRACKRQDASHLRETDRGVIINVFPSILLMATPVFDAKVVHRLWTCSQMPENGKKACFVAPAKSVL